MASGFVTTHDGASVYYKDWGPSPDMPPQGGAHVGRGEKKWLRLSGHRSPRT